MTHNIRETQGGYLDVVAQSEEERRGAKVEPAVCDVSKNGKCVANPPQPKGGKQKFPHFLFFLLIFSS